MSHRRTISAPWSRWLLRCGCLVQLTGGCGTTTLDVIEEEQAGVETPEPSASEPTPAVSNAPSASAIVSVGVPTPPTPTCPTPSGVKRLRLLTNDQCLVAGEPTMVGGLPAFEVELDADCSLPTAAWELTLSDVTNQVVELLNMSTGDNLDVQYGVPTVGAALVLFAPHGMANQQFRLVERPAEDGGFSLSPVMAPNLCVHAEPEQIVLRVCTPNAPLQVWGIEDFGCSPETIDAGAP